MSRSKKKYPIYKDKSYKRKLRSGITRARLKMALRNGRPLPKYRFAVHQWSVCDYKIRYWDRENHYMSPCYLSEFDNNRVDAFNALRDWSLRK